MRNIIVHGDGACSGNPGVGGWASLLEYDGKNIVITGGSPDATNNQMELASLIATFDHIIKNKLVGKIILNFDSMYVLDGTSKWLNNWSKNGWKGSNKKPIKNKEMWQEVYNLRSQILKMGCTIEYVHVKGHSGHEYNEYVDQLAVGACEHTKGDLKPWVMELNA